MYIINKQKKWSYFYVEGFASQNLFMVESPQLRTIYVKDFESPAVNILEH